jgi:glycosyltransferase involved in cell wall biosynthesis
VRILHLGWGFAPWRPGGLIAYAEDLMGAQREAGHEVSYFLSGRHYPYVSGPRLKRWRRDGVAMYEVINPPIVVALEKGTRYPERDLSEPRIEAAFSRVIEAVRPDLVHIQELLGLPSSLIDVAHAAEVPTAMTLHDYGPLCSTLRLFDADGRICMRRDVGADCVERNSDAPTDPGFYFPTTLSFEARRAREWLGLSSGPHTSLFERAFHRLGRLAQRDAARRAERRPAEAAAFQRRREVNVERLSRVGRLIAQSPRVAEIYRHLGVTGDRMIVLPAPARHIEGLRPRRLQSPPAPVTFATINGCASPSKGSHTVLTALRTLRAAGLEGSFRLEVFGWVDSAVREELVRYEGVEVRGLYERDELDGLLDRVDVGLMPSMWEEAYGYTGLEMVAKGIPLIANPLGGIVQYAREGTTAWLNRSCSGEELAELMKQVIREPELVVDMHHRVLATRDDLITPWNEHVQALGDVYGQLVA